MKNTHYLALAATLTLVAVCTAAEEAALHGIPFKGQDLLAAAELPVGAKREVPFSGLSVPPGRELVLALKARLDSPSPAGYTRGMRLTVNGQTLDCCGPTERTPTTASRTTGCTCPPRRTPSAATWRATWS